MEMELGGRGVPSLPDACASVNARFKRSTEGEYGLELGGKSKGKVSEACIHYGQRSVKAFPSASRREEMIGTSHPFRPQISTFSRG